ncbi:hypothetical protein PG985_013877 [Apiospora marii]|uniref:uncharacterized protein n=1 Tax=Apiospora marii TaxID=335849 RepID=UPI003132595F
MVRRRQKQQRRRAESNCSKPSEAMTDEDDRTAADFVDCPLGCNLGYETHGFIVNAGRNRCARDREDFGIVAVK